MLVLALLPRLLFSQVVIGTPNYTHADILRDALASSKHLLCEKPLCTTVEDCTEVLERVRAEEANGAERVFWMGLEYRYIPAIARLIREVDSGTCGDVRMVTIREHRFPFLQKVGLWNRDKRKSGDTLVEKCCHFFDLMARIAQTDSFPSKVYASGSHDVNMLTTTDTLDNAFVMVDFDNRGPRMMLEICMFAEASKNQEEVSVVGDKGKLEAFAAAHQRGECARAPNFRRGCARCPAPPNWQKQKRPAQLTNAKTPRPTDKHPPARTMSLRLRQLPWVDRVVPPPPASVEECHEGVRDDTILAAGYHAGATFFELQRFADCVRRGREPEVTAADGLLATTLGVAAQRSIELGRPVVSSDRDSERPSLISSHCPTDKAALLN
eukprot:COSAG01_NODE_5949_length_3939_cov_3.112500_6_plen_382_part_00